MIPQVRSHLRNFTFLSLTLGFSPAALHADSFAEAVTGGKGSISFRYRFENVDQDGISKDANASTLKTRINYKSLGYNGWSFFVEADDVSYIGSSDFNNTRNGKTNYPVVADPKGTGINQAYIDYDNDAVKFRLGRQRVLLDNQRFVGGVGWRQNEQTYDAFSITTKSLENTSIVYGYVSEVQRIFGPDKGTPPKDVEGDTHLLNVAFNLGDNGKLVLYGYSLDIDDAAALSTQTYGARYNNTFDLAVKTSLALEYAHQSDHGDNPTSFSADYYHLNLGLKFEKASVSFGYEVLGGDDSPGESFRTPLATLHAFNGWADKFLATPSAGIEDAYIGFKYGSFALTWHDFDAEASSASWGSELDMSYAYKINDHYSLLFKYADYDADDHATDTRKAWLMFTAKF